MLGAYDVTLFNYGPDKNYGSVHIELPETMTVDEVDRIIRRIGHLDSRDISGIEEAMRNHFGFDIPDCIEAP